jgi:hypothetical protein
MPQVVGDRLGVQVPLSAPNSLQKFPTSWSPDGKFLLYYAEGGP